MSKKIRSPEASYLLIVIVAHGLEHLECSSLLARLEADPGVKDFLPFRVQLDEVFVSKEL